MIAFSPPQSKQDKFATLVNSGRPGFFIDIGCSVPEFQSNIIPLWENGWRGICVDGQDFSSNWANYKEIKFINHDATNVDWKSIIETPFVVNYASVDVDNATFDALKNLLNSGIQMVCATVEHDAYRFGDTLRSKERQIMKEFGYTLVRENVKSRGCEYEDWYVGETVCNIEAIKKEVNTWVE